MCERKNLTILNMVRSLLMRSKVPKNFWPKVINLSLYILNGSPTLGIQNMTPEKAWNGRGPDVGYFKIFRYSSYAHIPYVRRKKIR